METYSHKNLQLFVALHLLFVEADGFVVSAAENTVTLHHLFPQSV